MLDYHLSFSTSWAIPFMGFLGSLALLPVFAPKFWHRYYELVLGFWIISLLIPLALLEGTTPTFYLLTETLLHHYIPFISLITALFTIGGGIHITMKGKASPLLNTGLLGLGACVSNIIGTMGASMLLIRPIIALNRYRQNMTHIVIFFIFLVSNIGGILTPLGDPPLFIGFLNGIDFFWTTTHLIYPFMIVGSAVLLVFWVMDHYYFFHDPSVPDPTHVHSEAKIQIKGRRNFIFLGVAIVFIIGESMITNKQSIKMLEIPINIPALIRDISLISLAFMSWKFTPPTIHEMNRFTWNPLREVAMVFLGIFITVTPVLHMLKAGASGPLGDLIQLVNPDNAPNAPLYFWITGVLSAFLDNAPTYLIFFNVAGGDASTLMNEQASILAAISMGAVFMGALTYIGNAPNFIIHSIAKHYHIKMPGFLGYILWSSCILLPIFFFMSWIWF